MQKRTFTDQLGRRVEIPSKPQRIISLVPSQTELLFSLGLDEEIAGITKFCIHPTNKFKEKQKIGGTKKLNLELIRSLNPDLIIGNKEENDRAQIEELMNDFPVWMSDIYNLQDALDMIGSVGEICNKEIQAESIIYNIKEGFKGLASLKNPEQPVKVAYFIWKNPLMIAGKNTFIDSLISEAGWINVFKKERYPEVSAEEISAAAPDLILLSSEPYPFTEKHLEEFKSICPGSKVQIVDGEMFSWYGSRLELTPHYLQKLITSQIG